MSRPSPTGSTRTWPRKQKRRNERMRRIVALLALGTLPLLAGQPRGEDADIVFADFEGETYGDWKTTGTAFGKGPARGALPGQMPVTGFRGRGLVNSFHGG